MNELLLLYYIIVTILIYLICRWLSFRFKHPLVNIVFLGTAAVILFLVVAGISYERYEPAKDIMTFLLGPATVALALPLYRKREMLKAYALPIITAILLGSSFTAASIVYIGKLGGLSRDILMAMSTKSVTTPIAIEIAKVIGGNPPLAVAFVAVTGTLGSMMAFPMLKLLRVTDPAAQGLAAGTLAHAQGAALALLEGQTQGAMAGIAFPLAAVFSSLVIPLIFLLL